MFTRVRFIIDRMKFFADSLSNVKWTIHPSSIGHLILTANDEMNFFIEYSEDLASGIGLQVEYNNGIVMFTDRAKFIQDTDYTIPCLDDQDCPVCLESYDPMFGSTCGHQCCVDCMRKMYDQRITRCPLCRSEEFRFPIAMACNQTFV